ncbi:hypothetical protein SLA2020_394090 [Shorea laevis]
MVFSSLPVYLDPPNWQQHQQGSSGDPNPQLPPLPPPVPVPAHVGAGGGGSIRPASMADRARLANIPQPEGPLKCPRCESTNTKFCYFNNYSLSQPRHFCKTCRRYWTRGGALRSVPVGGGCRRNKKNKSNSSKSSLANSSSTSSSAVSSAVSGDLLQQTPHLPFMASLPSLSQYGLGNIGLNFSGLNGQIGGTTAAAVPGQADLGFQITNSGGVQQFPFFEPPTGLYSYSGTEGIEGSTSVAGESQLRSVALSSRVSQLAPVKTEDNNQGGLNLSRAVLGVSENNNNQFWGGNPWTTTTDLSGLNSSTTNNHLL